MRLPQLRRVRWAVRATLSLGVAASVTANVLHAQPNPISQAIAAWPPLALLLTVELISRVPVLRQSLAMARLASTAIIAGIAAWVSYWHMAGVAAKYGETGASAYLLPLSVDGLIIVASVCLVELAGRIRMDEDKADDARTAVAAAHAAHAAAAVAAVPPTFASRPAPVLVPAAPLLSRLDIGAPIQPPAAVKRLSAATSAAPRQRRPVAETAALAAAIEAAHPDITEAEVAKQLGITTTRLKAVRRETRELATAA